MTHAQRAQLAPCRTAPFGRCAVLLGLGLLLVVIGLPPALAKEGVVTALKLEQPLSGLDTVAPATIKATPVHGPRFRHASFGIESATADARSVADWVVDSGDSRGMPFVIVDKKDAKVFVFNAAGRLRGAASALLGMALGDEAVPGIGQRTLASIQPFERTTPAGRFVAALDRNLSGKEILWVDYEGAVSMHPVVSANPSERRLQRLASVTPLDNRISYGCINVPAAFFANVVHPTFIGTNGIVYVLPEIDTSQKVFGSYDVAEQERLHDARQRMLPIAILPILPTAATN